MEFAPCSSLSYRSLQKITLNDPKLQRLEQAAVLGVASARDLARLFHLVLEGKILKRETLDEMLTPTANTPDIVTGAHVERGHGLMFSRISLQGTNFTLVGHSGYGGQNLRFDPEKRVVIAYLSNGLKVGFGDTARTWMALRDSLLSCLLS